MTHQHSGYRDKKLECNPKDEADVKAKAYVR